ncbi:hypothetical protein E1193_04870 [Micromonospora sp. KC606]|uniref:hypothetical protein n=1 Tax=Micromonospora sp. KC606 TaxID=2530379 RepID=UPI0010493FEF|nr:hypothetical protein [Micromonospora sp. KC606]TDC84661.1 hypothetical protein E1193_04870 [Micromonospora sp. KC606]
MLRESWLRRLGLVSAVAAFGLVVTPVAAHANDYDTPRSAIGFGVDKSVNGAIDQSIQKAREAILAVGTACTPGIYRTRLVYASPGGTWVYETTHEAMCVD